MSEEYKEFHETILNIYSILDEMSRRFEKIEKFIEKAGTPFPVVSVLPEKESTKNLKVTEEVIMTKQYKYDCKMLSHSKKAVKVLMAFKQQWFPNTSIKNFEEIDLEDVDSYQTFWFHEWIIIDKGLEALFYD